MLELFFCILDAVAHFGQLLKSARDVCDLQIFILLGSERILYVRIATRIFDPDGEGELLT